MYLLKTSNVVWAVDSETEVIGYILMEVLMNIFKSLNRTGGAGKVSKYAR